jgi:hypothetical protein
VWLRGADGKRLSSIGINTLQGGDFYEAIREVAWDGGRRAWVVAQSRSSGTYYVHPVTVTRTSIESDGKRFVGSNIALSPDGKKLALARKGLIIRDVESETERRVASVEGIELPAWAPDGMRIAAVQFRYPERTRVVLIDLTNEPATVTPLRPPGIAPDATATAVAWLGSRIVANIACCGPNPDEAGMVDAVSGAPIFVPPRRCPMTKGGPGYSKNGTDVTTMIPASCTVHRMRPDRTVPNALLYVDMDGHLSRWTATQDVLVSDELVTDAV